MRKIKKEKMQKALKEIVTDYRIKTKNIIKWYEYNMAYPDTPEEEKPEDIPDAMEIQNMMEDMTTEMEEEEIDLATTGLSEDEQALVADILERFKEAKQSSVDNLFANVAETAAPAADHELSEEELVAAICAPKQNNVDALVSEAYSGL